MRQRRHRLGFESLENRRLLAVEVLMGDGQVGIIGDFSDDHIIITESTDGTRWQILGTDGTTVSALFPVVDLDPDPNVLEMSKPNSQDIFLHLDFGADSLEMRGINQGQGPNAIPFIGKLTIDMSVGSDAVDLGSFLTPGVSAFNAGGSNANDFIAAVSVDVGSFSTVEEDADNTVIIQNTDFGRVGIAVGPTRGIAGQLTVVGGTGRDVVVIQGSSTFGGSEGNFAGSLSIDTREGEDSVFVGLDTVLPFQQDAVFVGGSVIVNTGEGLDGVVFDSLLAGDNITLSTGAGDDVVVVGDAQLITEGGTGDGSGTSTQGNLIIITGDGNDTVNVNYATTVNALHVQLGDATTENVLNLGGSSFSATSSISGGNVRDEVNLSAVNSPLGLHIQTGAGNDDVSILGTLVELGVCSILTRSGIDTVAIGGGSRFDTVVIATDGDSDTVTFGEGTNLAGNASVEEFFLDLGEGDDQVDSGSSTFGRAFVQGGAGSNTRSGQAFGEDVEGDFLFFEGFSAA